MSKVKQRIKKYIQRATLWDWITNGFFVIIILTLLIPSWRLYFQTTVLGWTMGSPDVKKELNEAELPGDWELYDKDAQTVKFDQFKNQKVFINFWASWCAPCLAEMPSLIQQSKELSNEVTFIFLTKDKKEKVLPIIEQYKDANAQFYFYSNYPEPLQHNSIPYSVWVNKGVKTAYYAGAAQWSNQDILSGFE